MKRHRLFAPESLEDRRLLASDWNADGAHRDLTENGVPEAKIVGGEVAQEFWPMMVSLADGTGHICGGTLVAPEIVVTAAHCVDGESVNSIQARIGRANLRTNEGETFDLSEFIIHPDYNSTTREADLAVLRLSRESRFEPVMVIRGDQPELTKPGATAIALGWGALDESVPPPIPDRLHRIDIPIVANAVANRPNAYDGAVLPNMLAAGSIGKDTCGGDSGGPLLVENELGEFVMVGVTSWGNGCGKLNFPGVYTRLSSFTDWLSPFLLPPTAGRVSFDTNFYNADSTAVVTLRDEDLVGMPSYDVVLTSSAGDSEVVTLPMSDEGVFRGSVQLSLADPHFGNGVLEVEDEGSINVTYVDQDYGNGEMRTVSSIASIFGDDHGNTASHASELTLGLSVNGELESIGDVDWFSLRMEAGKSYEIFTILRSLDDSVIRLYDFEANVVAENDDSGESTASKLIYQAPVTGTYFVEVLGFEQATGRYLLRAIESVAVDDHGNGSVDATVVKEGATSGEIDSSSDPDWFQFHAIAGVRYSISTSLIGLTDSFLRLLDTDGQTELASNDDINNSTASRIDWTAPTDGTRFFEVTGWQGDTGTYHVNFASEIPLDPFEPNDTLNTPADLPSDVLEFSNLTLHSPGDYDWYRWVAPETGFYAVRLDLDTALGHVDLRVTDGDVLIGESMGDSNQTAVFEADPSRPILLEVDGNGNSIARYGISISTMTPPMTGDLTNDGALRIDDIDALCSGLRNSLTEDRFDLNGDGILNELDLEFMLDDIFQTVFGDVSLDGRFDSSDLVRVFAAAEYEDSNVGNSSWSTGDWNCDGDFDSADLVEVFQRATYSSSAKGNALRLRGRLGELWWDRDDRRTVLNSI